MYLYNLCSSIIYFCSKKINNKIYTYEKEALSDGPIEVTAFVTWQWNARAGVVLQQGSHVRVDWCDTSEQLALHPVLKI
jgi:hypothetical protein